MAKLSKSQFQFQKRDKVGAEGAEHDTDFLADCFHDVGDLDVLRDCSRFERIVVGRTGSGKTALLIKLSEAEGNAVWIEPESLSLRYLANSTILSYLTDLGVELDLFYRLLWKHVFAVELIKARFKIDSESAKRNFLQRVYASFFGNKNKEKAMKYLVEWGESFWKNTDYRIKEVTKKLESDIRSNLGVKSGLLDTGVKSGSSLSTEERAEVVQRAQEVINRVQIHELGNVIRLLADEFFSDPQPRYYLIIDRLDEQWVDDDVRYRLIRALVETLQDFSRIASAKIVVAIRRDLLDRVIRATRDAGFQEEKYQAIYLTIRWTPDQLLELLDRRIAKLVKRQYTKQPVTRHDLLPKEVDGQPIDSYLIDRTMLRPRDLIVFFNCCIEHAQQRPSITATLLRQAEAEYSRRRFRSLGDEWYADYPNLLDWAQLLKGRSPTFRVSDLRATDVSELSLHIATHEPTTSSPLRKLANAVCEERMGIAEFRTHLVAVFYRVGLVGLKTEASASMAWSFSGHPEIQRAEIREDTPVAVSPVFHRVLGVSAARKAV